MNSGHIAAALLLALGGASCVSKQAADPPWAAGRPLTHLSQLDGVYRNEDEASSRDLYSFLDGRFGQSDPRADRVRLRASPDGRALEARLEDRHGKLLEKRHLMSGEDFVSRDGLLSLKIPAGVGLTGATNLGVFAGDAVVTLGKAESGGLLGRQSEVGGGLLFFLIPIAGSGEEHFLWRPDRG